MRKYEKPFVENINLLLADVILTSTETTTAAGGGGLEEGGEDNLD